jgi:hypothetical protein
MTFLVDFHYAIRYNTSIIGAKPMPQPGWSQSPEYRLAMMARRAVSLDRIRMELRSGEEL